MTQRFFLVTPAPRCSSETPSRFLGNRFSTVQFLATLFAGVICFSGNLQQTTFAQTSSNVDQQIQSHLDHGEFAAAIGLADQLDGRQADLWRANIARSQFGGGAFQGAYSSAGSIQDDVIRSQSLGDLVSRSNGTPRNGNQRGGVTEADFDDLVDLIKGNIAPDTWDDTNGDGTVQSYPAGVYVDASGALQKVKPASKALQRIRNQLLEKQSDWVTSESGLRKISLVKLERAAQMLVAQGKPIPPEMKNLGGLYGVKYVIAFPETGDVVIAGPAGPWELNEVGRPVNKETGLPVMQFDDLVVCLRNAYDNNGKFGCAITPRQQNLADTKAFLAQSKLRGNAWRNKLQEHLGMQDIEVFGIDPQTHTGRVLVEADYRMKLIGMGLEESITEIPSFLSRVEPNPDGTLPPLDVVRWWFTLNYDDVFADDDRLAFEFTGTGVKVLSENEMINEQGKRIHTGKSKGPTKAFADDFTDHYAEISKKYPIYQQLKNVFDMALVSAIIRQERLAERADWQMTFFRSTNESLSYQPAREATATQVNSVMNHRMIKQRLKGRTLKHTLVGVSGGISFDVSDVVSPRAIKNESAGALARTRTDAETGVTANDWWWD